MTPHGSAPALPVLSKHTDEFAAPARTRRRRAGANLGGFARGVAAGRCRRGARSPAQNRGPRRSPRSRDRGLRHPTAPRPARRVVRCRRRRAAPARSRAATRGRPRRGARASAFVRASGRRLADERLRKRAPAVRRLQRMKGTPRHASPRQASTQSRRVICLPKPWQVPAPALRAPTARRERGPR